MSLPFPSPHKWLYSPSGVTGRQIRLPKMHNSPDVLPRRIPLPRGWSRLGSSHVSDPVPSQLRGVPCSSAAPMAVLCFCLYLQYNQVVPFFPLSIFKSTEEQANPTPAPPSTAKQQHTAARKGMFPDAFNEYMITTSPDERLVLYNSSQGQEVYPRWRTYTRY